MSHKREVNVPWLCKSSFSFCYFYSLTNNFSQLFCVVKVFPFFYFPILLFFIATFSHFFVYWLSVVILPTENKLRKSFSVDDSFLCRQVAYFFVLFLWWVFGYLWRRVVSLIFGCLEIPGKNVICGLFKQTVKSFTSIDHISLKNGT